VLHWSAVKPVLSKDSWLTDVAALAPSKVLSISTTPTSASESQPESGLILVRSGLFDSHLLPRESVARVCLIRIGLYHRLLSPCKTHAQPTGDRSASVGLTGLLH
jgi:hypothetical protein